MGKALRPEHIAFFTARMDEHSRVLSWKLIADKHEYMFKIRRRLYRSENHVIVHLTDAYRYGLAEFYARPKQLRSGSYVVIGMPHASADQEVIDEARKQQIGIGHIGKFMGALNYKNSWEYMTPDERQQKEQEQRRRESEAEDQF